MTSFERDAVDAAVGVDRCPACDQEVVWFAPSQTLGGAWEQRGECGCPAPLSEEQTQRHFVDRMAVVLSLHKGKR